MREEAREPWRSGEDRIEVLLPTLVQEALSSQEIEDALRSAPGLTAESLASVAVRDRDAITRSAARAEHEYLLRRAEYRASGRVLLLSLRAAIASTLLLGATVAAILVTSSARWSVSAVLVVALAGFVLSILIRWVSFGSERRIAMSNVTAVVAWCVSLVGLVAAVASSAFDLALPLAFLVALALVVVPVARRLFGLPPAQTGLLSQSDRRRRRAAVLTAFAAWRRSLLVDGVEPALRAEITRHSTPTYATTVSLNPRSLATFRPTRQEVWVETEAGRALATLLTREQGSFALRGPRGSGKTTLMAVDGQLQLSEVTVKLAARELREACESAKDALVEVPDHLSVAALMRAFDEYTQKCYSDGALLAYARRLNDITAEQAAGLRDAVAALAYFLATLVAVFDHSLDQARMERATQGRPGGRFDALARIRRYLGINPQAAVELLDDFRQDWDLSPLNS